MKGLAGDFATMPLTDLVVYLGNRRASGILHFENDQVRKYVTLHEGAVVNASSNDPKEFLGQFLINMGHLTEDQFEKAYQTQKETQIFIGKILVMIGLVSEPVIHNALNLKFRETVLEAFNWPAGMFSYDPTAQGGSLDGLEARVELLDIHREAEFRETAWQAIKSAFPSGDVRLAHDVSKLPEPPKAGSLDERLFGLIDEGLTIDGIALALHASPFFLYQRLYALYRLEAVSIREDVPESGTSGAEDEFEFDFGDAAQDAPRAEDGAVSTGDEASADEVVQHALSQLQQGNLREAEMLARRAHELGPTPETTQLLRATEAALLTLLRRDLVEQQRIPALQLPQAKLRALALSAPERYLLSRIDGQRDVASIVTVSPLQELDALKFIQNFVDAGLVRLVARTSVES